MKPLNLAFINASPSQELDQTTCGGNVKASGLIRIWQLASPGGSAGNWQMARGAPDGLQWLVSTCPVPLCADFCGL